MGYYSDVEGTLTITDTKSAGKLSLNDIEDNIKNNDDFHWIVAVDYDLNGFVLEAGNNGKAYEIVKEFENLVKFFKKNGYRVDGEVYVIGEEFPDFSRIKIVNNAVDGDRGKVSVVFPDGSEWKPESFR